MKNETFNRKVSHFYTLYFLSLLNNNYRHYEWNN